MLTIMQKVKIPKKIDKSKLMHNLRECYAVGNTTIYIKKQCEKLLNVLHTIIQLGDC